MQVWNKCLIKELGMQYGKLIYLCQIFLTYRCGERTSAHTWYLLTLPT